MKRVIRWSLAVVAVAAITFAAYYFTRPSWPDFPATAEKTPQAKVKVAERDYGYRIGDVIPVELVIRQQPGTRVVVSDMTVSGDFELHEKNPTLQVKEFEDGSALYRVTFKLQSFETKARLSFKAQVSWVELEKNKGEVFDVPETKIGYSMTWDGRKEMQEGSDTRSVIWYWARAIVPLTFGSVLYLTLIVMAVRRWWKARQQVPPEKLIQTRFLVLLEMVGKDTATCEKYRELEAIVREHWHIQSVPVDELARSLRREPAHRETLQDFLGLTAMAIYPQSEITAEQRLEIVRLGQGLKHALLTPKAKPREDAYQDAIAEHLEAMTVQANANADAAVVTEGTPGDGTPEATSVDTPVGEATLDTTATAAPEDGAVVPPDEKPQTPPENPN
ncbi:MAG: hypothetical protein K2W95_14815 [Candidatus Obscuribacterales bacterium]|nr:hypothetical protein [Candidatus Obscuribacterales bacterium]